MGSSPTKSRKLTKKVDQDQQSEHEEAEEQDDKGKDDDDGSVEDL